MIKNKKIAFVCALHESKAHRPNGFELFNNYLVSIYTSCKYPFKLFAFDNQSDHKFEVENQPDNLLITRVDDQYTGGCTYTWNERKQEYEGECEQCGKCCMMGGNNNNTKCEFLLELSDEK